MCKKKQRKMWWLPLIIKKFDLYIIVKGRDRTTTILNDLNNKHLKHIHEEKKSLGLILE